MYYVNCYHLKEKKAAAYQQWLLSDEAKALFSDVEKETGWHYVETFWSIMGFGEYACEDWLEVPDWSSFDKLRDSAAMDRLFKRYDELDFFDNTRPSETRMLRTTRDVKVWD